MVAPGSIDRPSRPPGGAPVVPLRTAAGAWFGISLRTFGGPAGQIAVMHRELVEERGWIGERRFLHALSYCTVLPGPEAQQLAIYLGWLINGTAGGLIAGALFVLPGYVALMVLSAAYVAWGSTTAVMAVFAGLGPAVLAIVAQAIVRIGGRVVTTRFLLAVSVGAFVALFVFGVPFPMVVAGAAVVGYAAGRVRPEMFVVAESPADPTRRQPLIADDVLEHARPSSARALVIIVLGGALWAIPVAAAALALGGDHVLVDQAVFFSGTAVVTFGGAYAVLSFVAERAVDTFRWLLPGEMVHGLALAETTPGPLIMVVQFVGFLGAYRNPGSLDPWLAGVLGATMVVWVTFVPCFVFVFLGAPHAERLRHDRRLAAALTGVMAAVVGVIAELALRLSWTTLFARTRTIGRRPVELTLPVWATMSPAAVAVAAVAAVLVARKWGVLRVFAACIPVGATLHLLGR